MTASSACKVALVTGGGQGIGKGIAKGLLTDRKRVVIADIDGEAAEETAVQRKASPKFIFQEGSGAVRYPVAAPLYLLPNTFRRRSVVWAAGFVLIFFSSSPTITKRPSKALLVT